MINGVINVYKEAGFTSHDVVAKLRGILKQKKIGHTGTLDPDATGVLPVCLGTATKLCDMLTDKNKTYEAVMLLGKQTDTQDISGEVINEAAVTVDEEAVREAVMSFVGEYDQVPPMYSALKVNGKKLYELAREGVTVERKARKVQILSVDIKSVDMDNNTVTMEVECSKGTYIRTLCEDIGNKLGCYGCMKALKRIRVSSFGISDAKTLDEIANINSSGKLDDILVRVDSVFCDCKAINTPAKADVYLYNGNKLDIRNFECRFKAGEKVRVYDSKDVFCGLYEYIEAEKMLKPVKMFLDR